jgi:hypothetical protein
MGVIISFNNIESMRTIQTGTISTSSQKSRKTKHDEKTEKSKDIGCETTEYASRRMDKKFRYELDKEDLQCHIKSNRV